MEIWTFARMHQRREGVKAEEGLWKGGLMNEGITE